LCRTRITKGQEGGKTGEQQGGQKKEKSAMAVNEKTIARGKKGKLKTNKLVEREEGTKKKKKSGESPGTTKRERGEREGPEKQQKKKA